MGLYLTRVPCPAAEVTQEPVVYLFMQAGVRWLRRSAEYMASTLLQPVLVNEGVQHTKVYRKLQIKTVLRRVAGDMWPSTPSQPEAPRTRQLTQVGLSYTTFLACLTKPIRPCPVETVNRARTEVRFTDRRAEAIEASAA